METYQERVAALEAEGLTTSDAQGVVDAEMMREGRASLTTKGRAMAMEYNPEQYGIWYTLFAEMDRERDRLLGELEALGAAIERGEPIDVADRWLHLKTTQRFTTQNTYASL